MPLLIPLARGRYATTFYPVPMVLSPYPTTTALISNNSTDKLTDYHRNPCTQNRLILPFPFYTLP